MTDNSNVFVGNCRIDLESCADDGNGDGDTMRADVVVVVIVGVTFVVDRDDDDENKDDNSVWGEDDDDVLKVAVSRARNKVTRLPKPTRLLDKYQSGSSL